MNIVTKLLLLSALLLTTSMVYSIEWAQEPEIENNKLIRTALWERNSREIVSKNAYADEASCVYNAANCAIDQVRNRVY